MLKIVYSFPDDSAEQHARNLMRAIDKYGMTRNPHSIPPKGIAYHQAQHASRCDECGTTYWTADEYAPHFNCKGAPRKTGF